MKGFTTLGITEILLLALGLSMDAFAVSLTNGLCIKGKTWRLYAFLGAFFFGLFQALMPLLGYLLGGLFSDLISQWGSLVAFLLLGFIGVKMIIDGIKELKSDEDICETKKYSIPSLLIQALATSIDAFVVGVSLAALQVKLFSAVSIIGIVTFVLCLLAFFIGRKFGAFLGSKSQIVGGVVLLGIGVKILIG